MMYVGIQIKHAKIRIIEKLLRKLDDDNALMSVLWAIG